MIICPNCKNQLADNAAFCHICGTQLARQNYAPQQGYGYPEQQVQQPQYAQQPYQPIQQPYQQNAPIQPPYPQPKKKNKGLIIGIVAGVLVVLAAIGAIAQKAAQNQGYGNDDVRGDIISGDNNASQETEPEFSMGKAANGVYKNDFLGLSCTLPAGWEFYSDEQIKEMNNITADFYTEEFSQQIQNATIIYDMLAVNTENNSSINLNLEKLNPLQMIGLDIKQVLESQFDTIKTTYENMGYTGVDVQYKKVSVDGKELDGLVTTANIQGVNLYCVLFSFPKGSYLANVSITTIQTDTTQQILDCFSFE